MKEGVIIAILVIIVLAYLIGSKKIDVEKLFQKKFPRIYKTTKGNVFPVWYNDKGEKVAMPFTQWKMPYDPLQSDPTYEFHNIGVIESLVGREIAIYGKNNRGYYGKKFMEATPYYKIEDLEATNKYPVK